MSEQERTLAYHEAAHAVVDWALGIRVQKVSLASAPLSGNVALPQDQTPEPTARIIGLLAGPICDDRLGQGIDPDGSDVLDAVRIINASVGSEAQLQARLDKLWKRTERLLDQLWPAIEAVAQALLEKRSLSGEQVEAIIRDTKEA